MRVSVLFGQRRVLVDGRELPRRSPRWFDLLAYLAYRRKFDDADSGFVGIPELMRQVDWGRCNAASVGKQIRRATLDWAEAGFPHVLEARDSLLKGPYRLAQPAERIALDRGRDAAARWLRLREHDEGSAGRAERSYAFAEAVAVGERAYACGALRETLDAFQRADALAADADQRLYTLGRIARVQRLLGARGDAVDTLARLDDLRRAVAHEDVVARVTLSLEAGWLAFQEQRLDEAEACAHQGMDLLRDAPYLFVPLGRLHTLLGEVAEARGAFGDAEERYARALELWVVGEWAWGVQAAYFNLGQLERVRGDALLRTAARRGRSGLLDESARRHYERARTWMEREMAYCARAQLGFESCLDRLELARIAARCGALSESASLLDECDAHVRRTGNQPERARAERLRAAVARYARDGDVIALLDER